MKEKNKEKNGNIRETMSQSDKRKMFLSHCYQHPMDVLRLGKATVLYGTEGVKARADELARKEWDRQNRKEEDEEESIVYNIKFSIIISVYDGEITWLEKTLLSIKNQKYSNWEVCIGVISKNSEIHEYLEAITDNRIKVKYLEENQGNAEALNEVAAIAKGSYLLLVDIGDELSLNALCAFYNNLSKTNADVIYSDMDRIDEKGRHFAPLFKPDWSPELLRSQMYMRYLIGIKRKLFEQYNGFSSEYDGAEVYDLLLRMSENTDKIAHVSEILYSRRKLHNSSNTDSKLMMQLAGKNAIQAHLDRTIGKGAAIVETIKNRLIYDIRYYQKEWPLVSIIIPTKDHANDLKTALDSIFSETVYDRYEIIILDNNSEKEESFQYFDEIQQQHENIRVVPATYEFNWSKLNNQGIDLAKGDVLVFLNNDVKVIEPTWLQRMVEYTLQPGIGVVGGQLLYEDGTIQHAGVVIGMGGWADHVYKGMQPKYQITPFISPMVVRNVMACTGACMAISRKVIKKIGGFDERFIICGSDVEICIRAIDEGYRNVYVPQAKLYHYESKSRDSYIPQIDFELSDIMYMGYRKGGDPYYNKNLRMDQCIPGIIEKPSSLKRVKSMNVGIDMIRELHFRKVKREKERLNLLLPALNSEYVFGGIATALRCFEALGEALDCDMRIVLVDVPLSPKAAEKYGKKYKIVYPENDSKAKKQIVSMAVRKGNTLAVSDKDQFMFSAWWTAYIVQNEYRQWEHNDKLTPRPFLYLIQDYEPGFYAWSSYYSLAESTYRCEYPQIAIFNSHELKEYMTAKGYKFMRTYCFEPILDLLLKKSVHELDSTVYKRKQILVYGRPSVARNAFEIIVEALRKWVSIQIGVESWTVLSAGEQHEPVHLGEGMYLNSVGKLTIEEYAKILRESYAGISLMISPHPSYPPLEMSAFDVQVITNGYANKDMSIFSENIISVNNLNAVQIAYELKKICDGYHTVVPHRVVNEEYINAKEPFGFIQEFKKDLIERADKE
ncbi:glycosyltransferase family 2 protein [Sporofaciens musculi]|jgi:GT2 family glycosyltransferase|uniref:glycosyltransferase family 2 protein n=1 Tax=Sporofaciens musculi TaxID=2681861 RepID=UPI0025A2204F|nr:glycosyltransferase family 2 protein [Sporofaciens musculi]